MEWYRQKEKAAGTGRLVLSWYIYKFFGKSALKFVAFWVTFFAFLKASETRKYSAEYLRIVGLKQSIVNQFKHFLSYSYALIDKMEACADCFDYRKICFDDEKVKDEFLSDVKEGKGVFLICSHLGNTDVLRSLFFRGGEDWNINTNIFLSENQCRIFNEFLKTISVESNIVTYPVEKIGVDTSIELKEKLQNGELIFMAGDRVPATGSAVFEEKFLNHTVKFPKGTFKFAKLMEVPIYFIALMKEKDRYVLYLQKAQNPEPEYVRFLEQLTLKYPMQFFHFYGFFQ